MNKLKKFKELLKIFKTIVEDFNAIINKTFLTVFMKNIQSICKGLCCFSIEINKLNILKIFSDITPMWIKIRNLGICLPMLYYRLFLPDLNMEDINEC